MKKIISTILGMMIAFSLNASVANAAAKEVRVAYFLEWPSPNLEDMNKAMDCLEAALKVYPGLVK